MPELLKQFVLDANDILERMGEALLALEKEPDDDAMIDELFRAAHTLKGNSGLFDIPTFTRVVHAAEDLLDKVRGKELSIDNDMTDELLNAMDFIQRMVEIVEITGRIPDRFTTEAEERIANLRARIPEPAEAEATGQGQENPDQVKPPENLDWLSLLAEQDSLRIFAEAEGDLCGVLYRPEPECFFKGEDPVLLLRTMPGRAAFSMKTVEPYGDPGAVDVYRCNLDIQALSRAPHAQLREHFRYVPEQVALYPIPRWRLACPQGAEGCDAGLKDEFSVQAERALETGDRVGLRAAAEAMLDLLNPELRAASALRWLAALSASDAPADALAALLDAFRTGQAPAFTSGPVLATSAAPPAAIHSPAASAALAAQEKTTLATSGLGMLGFEILQTQRKLLDMPVAEEQWEGRLTSISNTLKGLLARLGSPAVSSGLDQVLDTCRAQADFVPLAFFLDALLDRSEADTVLGQQTAVLPNPAIEPSNPAQSRAPEERATEGDASEVGRSGDHSERGPRVLKVPQEKIDRLMDLIGEMVVAKNALPYLAAKAETVYGSRDLAREIKAQFAVINRIAEDMQDGIMQVRMLPMGHVFQRFPRLVRDVARQLGKKVRLVLEGEGAEADKHIVESLGDPLIHILRNSLDHGIETPQARRAAGKPEEGRILVRASQEGDRVRIEIEDDGRGIDPAIVKRKAFEKGLVDEARLESMTDAEAIQFIFAPGFSTAETVSDLSGRGVGMDVVNSSIQKIGGQIRLTSEKGRGTRILLTLPLSVSVSHVLMVTMGGQRYGMPMDVVVETVRVPRADIHVIKDRRVAVLRGQVVPLFGADQVLKLPDPPIPNSDDEFAVLIVRIDGSVVGLIVDGFAQTTDVILKPLDGPLAALKGFLGSALLGDGSVLLVLDIKELMYAD